MAASATGERSGQPGSGAGLTTRSSTLETISGSQCPETLESSKRGEVDRTVELNVDALNAEEGVATILLALACSGIAVCHRPSTIH